MDMRKEAEDILGRIIEWRRHVHQNPELGLETAETERYIIDELHSMGIEDVRGGIGGHGVRAVVTGTHPGRVIAFRGDCDGLPVKEETGLPFASTNGCMQACGHDAHTAMLLGTAYLINKHREEMKGKAVFIFQPGEEPVLGAKAMIDDGVLEDPDVEEILGLHTGVLWKGFKAGEIGVRHGSMLASLDKFVITLRGKGGHGATPHMTVDPISMAGQLIVKLQTIISREKDPLDGAVLTIGKICGGTAYNVIPDECTMEGTVRTLDPETRTFLEKRIREIADHTAKSMRGEAEIAYVPGPPPLINTDEIVDKIENISVAVMDRDKVREIRQPSLGSEDFAYYLERIPGAFIFHAGCNPDKGQVYPNHNSRFDIDEQTLWIGPALFAEYALTQ